MKRLLPSLAIVALVLSACAMDPDRPRLSQAQNAPACVTTNAEDVASLFDRWNDSLQTGDPKAVVANYAPRSVLLPTLSNEPRLTAEGKEDYFHHFLESGPVGRIDSRTIEIDCTTAVDVGLYTFSFKKTGAQVKARYTFTYKWDGKQWLISSHHSSAMPESSSAP